MSNEPQKEYEPEEELIVPPEEEPEEEEEEPKEEGPSLGERVEDVRDQIERGKKIYEKLKKPKDEAPGAKTTGDVAQGADKGLESTAGTGAKQAGKQAGKEAGKQAGKQAGKEAGKAAAKTAVKVAAEAATAPETGGLSIIAIELADRLATFAQKHKKTIKKIIVVLLICSVSLWLVLGAFCAWLLSGGGGKTTPQPAGKNNVDVKALTTASAEPARSELAKNPLTNPEGIVKDRFKLEFLNPEDKEYIESGQIDQRLAAALNYIVQKHEHIRISHIISGYKDMETNPESGSFHDVQISQNVSAHKDGLAADIDQIDFVKKKCKCGGLIPVKVAWQAQNENIYGTTPPNILDQIKTAKDLLSAEVKAALEQLGIGGLDQPGLEDKLETITGINSVFDLTKPEVINALKAIGITGIDNENLQNGIKRLEALRNLYELNPEDLAALSTGAGKDLMNQLGVNITPEMAANIQKFQVTKVLSNIRSFEDLRDPEVQAALRELGVDLSDPTLVKAIDQMVAANIIRDWDGNLSDPNFTQALETLGIPMDDKIKEAISIYRTARELFESDPGTIVANVDVIAQLEQMGIFANNPDAQRMLDIYRTAQQVKHWDGNVSDPAFQAVLGELGIDYSDKVLPLLEKYQAARYILDFRGDLNDVQLQAALEKLGVPADKLEELRALADPMAILERYTNTEGLPAEAMQGYRNLNALTNIRNVSDLQKPEVQTALKDLGIDISSEMQTLVKLTSLSVVLEIHSIEDLSREDVRQALSGLNIPEEVFDGIGKIGSIEVLANIHNPMDITRPEVQAALRNLGIDINIAGMEEILGQAGSINALLSIQNPQDLLRPDVLKALDDLGIIKIDSATMGQIGAIGQLLQIRDIGDLLNPSTIAALNTLGIISITNPVFATIMVVYQVFNIIKSIFGCKGNTKCYKPTAEANVHQVIEELLQFPGEQGERNVYRVTQLITFSQELDVDPFSDQLNNLYGYIRPRNYGLFAMPEAWAHLHIAY